MTAFASADEFAVHMQDTAINTAAAVSALNIATARIISTVGQSFTYVADDAITLPGGSQILDLPQRPVLSVTSVATASYTEMAPVAQALGTTWTRSGSALVWRGGPRPNQSPALPYVGWVWPDIVDVVYTHGFLTIPGDVKGCCLMLAAEIYTSPDGRHYESIDDYAWRRGDAVSTPAAIALKALKAAYGQGLHSLQFGA